MSYSYSYSSYADLRIPLQRYSSLLSLDRVRALNCLLPSLSSQLPTWANSCIVEGEEEGIGPNRCPLSESRTCNWNPRAAGWPRPRRGCSAPRARDALSAQPSLSSFPLHTSFFYLLSSTCYCLPSHQPASVSPSQPSNPASQVASLGELHTHLSASCPLPPPALPARSAKWTGSPSSLAPPLTSPSPRPHYYPLLNPDE